MRTEGEVVDIAASAQKRATSSPHGHRSRPLPRFNVDEKLLRRMRDAAGALGHFEALMLATIAMDDLWLLCALTEEQAQAVAKKAYAHAERGEVTQVLAKELGRIPSGGGQA